MILHYSSDSDISLESFLQYCIDEGRVDPSFIGIDAYYELWDNNYIEFDIATIRFMSDGCSFDACYSVLSRTEIRGLDIIRHSGESGIHKLEDIFKKGGFVNYEVSNINPNPS